MRYMCMINNDTYDMHTYAYDTTNVLKFILYFLLKKRAI